MLKFLVCTTAIVIASTLCEEFGESGLHFDQNSAYASGYNNYQPHDYHFDYAVSDPHTGDHKSQWEVKDKGVVRGGYSLLEPDGTTRIVEYIADDDGFRAVVKKLGTGIHPEHVETHGFYPEHVETHGLPAPIISEPIAEEPHYQAYDGQVENYANVLGAAVQHLEPISHQQPIEIPQSVDYHGYFEQNQPIEYQQAQAALPLIPGFLGNPQTQVFESGYFQEQHPGQHSVAVEYHGYTGNPDDDSAYTNYEHAGSYSEHVQRVVPAPAPALLVQAKSGGVKQAPISESSNQFLIYYPGTPEHK